MDPDIPLVPAAIEDVGQAPDTESLLVAALEMKPYVAGFAAGVEDRWWWRSGGKGPKDGTNHGLGFGNGYLCLLFLVAIIGRETAAIEVDGARRNACFPNHESELKGEPGKGVEGGSHHDGTFGRRGGDAVDVVRLIDDGYNDVVLRRIQVQGFHTDGKPFCLYTPLSRS